MVSLVKEGTSDYQPVFGVFKYWSKGKGRQTLCKAAATWRRVSKNCALTNSEVVCLWLLCNETRYVTVSLNLLHEKSVLCCGEPI